MFKREVEVRKSKHVYACTLFTRRLGGPSETHAYIQSDVRAETFLLSARREVDRKKKRENKDVWHVNECFLVRGSHWNINQRESNQQIDYRWWRNWMGIEMHAGRSSGCWRASGTRGPEHVFE